MNLYTFYREDGWYPIVLTNDVEAAHHVLFNPGTVKVVNETTGTTVINKNKKSIDWPLIDGKHQTP